MTCGSRGDERYCSEDKLIEKNIGIIAKKELI